MSAIDALLPISGHPTTASVRANFLTAKIEIDQLREQIAALEARIATLENRQLRVVNGR